MTKIDEVKKIKAEIEELKKKTQILEAKPAKKITKNAHCVRKQIQKHSSLKKVAQLAKQSVFVFHAMFVQSAWNTHLHMTNVLEFGADYQSANVVA